VPHLDLSVSWINEGNPDIVRRNGAAAQVWAVNSFFDGRLSLGIGYGPYFYVDKKNPPPPGTTRPPAVAGLGSPTLAQRFAGHWLVRLTFSRVTTTNSRDADIYLLGIGYRWSL